MKCFSGDRMRQEKWVLLIKFRCHAWPMSWPTIFDWHFFRKPSMCRGLQSWSHCAQGATMGENRHQSKQSKKVVLNFSRRRHSKRKSKFVFFFRCLGCECDWFRFDIYEKCEIFQMIAATIPLLIDESSCNSRFLPFTRQRQPPPAPSTNECAEA